MIWTGDKTKHDLDWRIHDHVKHLDSSLKALGSDVVNHKSITNFLFVIGNNWSLCFETSVKMCLALVSMLQSYSCFSKLLIAFIVPFCTQLYFLISLAKLFLLNFTRKL